MFRATVYVSAPLPEPPPLSVIHDGGTDGDQAHPGWVVTVNAPVTAGALTFSAVGATE